MKHENMKHSMIADRDRLFLTSYILHFPAFVLITLQDEDPGHSLAHVKS